MRKFTCHEVLQQTKMMSICVNMYSVSILFTQLINSDRFQLNALEGTPLNRVAVYFLVKFVSLKNTENLLFTDQTKYTLCIQNKASSKIIIFGILELCEI